MALQLKGISPKAYCLLKRIFVLPSLSTLNRLINTIDIKPGFHAAVLEALHLKAKSLIGIKKIVVLAYDEMSPKENVFYNSSIDAVEGKQNMGSDSENSNLLANHASVFMVRSISEKWKQPMGYFLTNGNHVPQNN